MLLFLTFPKRRNTDAAVEGARELMLKLKNLILCYWRGLRSSLAGETHAFNIS